MLEEFSNPTLLGKQVNQENFVDIMCKNYTYKQIIEQLYKKNLIKKLIENWKKLPWLSMVKIHKSCALVIKIKMRLKPNTTISHHSKLVLFWYNIFKKNLGF